MEPGSRLHFHFCYHHDNHSQLCDFGGTYLFSEPWFPHLPNEGCYVAVTMMVVHVRSKVDMALGYLRCEYVGGRYRGYHGENSARKELGWGKVGKEKKTVTFGELNPEIRLKTRG